jgi:hypothetical protein
MVSEAFFPHSYLNRRYAMELTDPLEPLEHPPHRGSCQEYEEAKRMDQPAHSLGSPDAAPGPVCQFCLADPRYTPISPSKEHRCPVCGASYRGPRRDREFRALVEAGLVASG